MVGCAVHCCKSSSSKTSEKGISYHIVPTIISNQCQKTRELSEKRRNAWLRCLKQKRFFQPGALKSGIRICSKHFISGKPAKLFDVNNIDWIPTLNLNYDKICYAAFNESLAMPNELNQSLPIMTQEFTVAERLNQTLPTMTVENQELNQNLMVIEVDDELNQQPPSSSTETSALTLSNELSTTVLENNELMIVEDQNLHVPSSSHEEPVLAESPSKSPDSIQSELNASMNRTTHSNQIPDTESEHLRHSVDKECQTEYKMEDFIAYEMEKIHIEGNNTEKYAYMDEDYVKADEARSTYYTGLPSLTVIMAVFNLVTAHLKTSVKSKLSPFQEFMIFILKIRLNLDNTDLGFRFSVSPSTISRNFDKWFDIMYIRLKPLLRWPTREELQLTMPASFKQVYGTKVVVIIDCFEIFMERPSSLDARAETWSQYKHHNTVKFLIGIAPQGLVTFISKGWGGRTSDKHITEHCGIYRNLLPEDLILADRGFLIEDSVSVYGAKVAIPSFTKGKTQLPAKEVTETRKIANVRIHVERVIGLLRNKFTILQSTLPIDYVQKIRNEDLTKIDKITAISCCLVNACESIVSN